jgi:hypothetical protein
LFNENFGPTRITYAFLDKRQNLTVSGYVSAHKSQLFAMTDLPRLASECESVSRKKLLPNNVAKAQAIGYPTAIVIQL